MKSLLTQVMKDELVRMLANNWISYRNTSTHTALGKHGYVTKHSGRTYGKAHWCLTQAGVDMARELRGPEAVR